MKKYNKTPTVRKTYDYLSNTKKDNNLIENNVPIVDTEKYYPSFH